MASEKRLYQARLTRAAVKTLEGLPLADRRRIARAIDALAGRPRPRGCEKVARGGALLRIREGPYRVIYNVDDMNRTILVVTVGHRRDVYRGLP